MPKPPRLPRKRKPTLAEPSPVDPDDPVLVGPEVLEQLRREREAQRVQPCKPWPPRRLDEDVPA